MDQTITILLEAHVQHEMGRFKSKKYRQAIREEVAAVFQWIKKIKLREIVTPEQIISLIERNVVELPVAEGITELAGEMSQRVLASPKNKTTSLSDIFSRKSYKDIVDKIGGLEQRQKRLHPLVGHQFRLLPADFRGSVYRDQGILADGKYFCPEGSGPLIADQTRKIRRQ